MLPAHGVQSLDQLLAARQVEAGRRFVEQQEPRLGLPQLSASLEPGGTPMRAGDERPAALPLGEDRPAGVGEFAEAEGVDEPIGPVPLILRRPPTGERGHGVGQPGQDHPGPAGAR